MSHYIAVFSTQMKTLPGSDLWDLPNRQLAVDGEIVPRLLYNYRKTGGLGPGVRGICACQKENRKGGRRRRACLEKDKQTGCLISWSLAHTANKNNNWKGCFGRVPWCGVFKTITDPEPLGEQGQVLHPDQNRLVSVRECARSQGFPDTFCLWGQ